MNKFIVVTNKDIVYNSHDHDRSYIMDAGERFLINGVGDIESSGAFRVRNYLGIDNDYMIASSDFDIIFEQTVTMISRSRVTTRVDSIPMKWDGVNIVPVLEEAAE